MPGDHAHGDIHDTTPPNPVPFLIALAGFVVIAVLAFVFLRPEDDGELVRPDRFSVVDHDTIRAFATEASPCRRIDRAQVDLGEDEIFVEFVVKGEDPDCDVSVLEADITLPEPVDDRELRPGVGRLEIPCETRGSSVLCATDR